jgi:hypothetical protein
MKYNKQAAAYRLFLLSEPRLNKIFKIGRIFPALKEQNH